VVGGGRDVVGGGGDVVTGGDAAVVGVAEGATTTDAAVVEVAGAGVNL
jgi:hypothetical protein